MNLEEINAVFDGNIEAIENKRQELNDAANFIASLNTKLEQSGADYQFLLDFRAEPNLFKTRFGISFISLKSGAISPEIYDSIDSAVPLVDLADFAANLHWWTDEIVFTGKQWYANDYYVGDQRRVPLSSMVGVMWKKKLYQLDFSQLFTTEFKTLAEFLATATTVTEFPFTIPADSKYELSFSRADDGAWYVRSHTNLPELAELKAPKAWTELFHGFKTNDVALIQDIIDNYQTVQTLLEEKPENYKTELKNIFNKKKTTLKNGL